MEMNFAKIGDICIKTCSGGTPKSNVEAYYNPPTVPWLNTSEVNFNRIYSTQKFISEEGLTHSSAKFVPENTIIIAMYGQTAGRVAINKIPLTTNQACCNLMIDPAKADYQYVFYALSNMYKDLIVLKSGGAQPNLNAGKIKNFVIPLPDINVQRQIGKILSAYDDMIDNCKKQIALLEEAAQRLYREWFVDMRFPCHETTPIGENGLPEGWRNGMVSEIGTFTRGKNLLTSQAQKGEVPVIAGGLKPSCFHNRPNTSSPVITISGSGANAGYSAFYMKPIWASDCSFCDTSMSKFLPYLYCFFKHNPQILFGKQKGSAQPHVYAKDVNSTVLIIPELNILNSFCDITLEYFTQIGIMNDILRESLKSRNLLLPRLISGQIEINTD